MSDTTTTTTNNSGIDSPTFDLPGFPKAQFKRVKPSDLHANPKQPRSAAALAMNVKRIQNSVNAFGVLDAVKVLDDGTTITGHTRAIALSNAIASGAQPANATLPAMVFPAAEMTEDMVETLLSDHSAAMGLSKPELAEYVWARALERRPDAAIAYTVRESLAALWPTAGAKFRQLESELGAKATVAMVAKAVIDAYKDTFRVQLLPWAFFPEALREAKLASLRIEARQLDAKSELVTSIFDLAGIPSGKMSNAAQKLAPAWRKDSTAGQFRTGIGGPVFDNTLADIRAEYAKAGAPDGPTMSATADDIRKLVGDFPDDSATKAFLVELTTKNGEPGPIGVEMQRDARFLAALATIGSADFRAAVVARNAERIAELIK